MVDFNKFPEITKVNEPLAPYTGLKLGGNADYLIEPRNPEELAEVVKACHTNDVPFRVLGGGCNVLIPDDGVRGAVIRLSDPSFSSVKVDGRIVRAGAGVTLSTLISEAAKHSLAGLEPLIGIRGTLGGALRSNVGDRVNEIAQFVRRIETLDATGALQSRTREQINFGSSLSDVDDPFLLTIELELEPDDSDAIVKRMRKAWIVRKASRPFSYQPSGRIFQNPRGLNAAVLIEQAGLIGTKVGGVEVSDRDANYLIVHEKTSSRDVLRLIDLIQSKVREQFDVELQPEITVW